MPKKDWWPHEFHKLVTLGESTTAGGWSTSRERCWVSVLAELISEYQSHPVELFNAGIGANLISPGSPAYLRSGRPAAHERLDKHVFAQQPDLLIISYGLNDARSGTPLDFFKAELVRLVRRIREKINPLIVLLGPYYNTDFTAGAEWFHCADLALLYKFNQVVADVANAEGCLFVDVLQTNGETDWMVHYDGMHANDLGHRIIANRTFEVLAQNCSGLALRTKEAEKTSPRWRDEAALKADYGTISHHTWGRPV